LNADGAGISDQSYSYSPNVEHPLYDEGQGTRRWIIISTIHSTLIIKVMPERVNWIQFQDAHLTLLVKRIMDGFVDNTTIWQNT
jgi:hypothetical protein